MLGMAKKVGLIFMLLTLFCERLKIEGRLFVVAMQAGVDGLILMVRFVMC
jgi:hypothetical protein